MKLEDEGKEERHNESDHEGKSSQPISLHMGRLSLTGSRLKEKSQCENSSFCAKCIFFSPIKVFLARPKKIRCTQNFLGECFLK